MDSPYQQKTARNLVLLWDIDKTLVQPLTTRDLFLDAMSQAGVTLGDASAPKKDGKTDYQIMGEYLVTALKQRPITRDLAELHFVCMENLEQLSRETYVPGSLAPIPGVAGALELAARAGVQNGLYTGNTSPRALLKLRAAGLIAHDEPSCFIRACCFFQGMKDARFADFDHTKEQLEGNRVVVVGDAQLDYELAVRLDALFWQVGTASLQTHPDVRIGGCAGFEGSRAQEFLEAVLAHA